MSSQSTSIIWGPPSSLNAEESSISELQQIAVKLQGILRRRWWLFILTFLGVVTACLTVSLFMPRTYSAITHFERRDDAVLSKILKGKVPQSYETLRQTINNNITGHQAVSLALQNMGLTENLPRGEKGELTHASVAQKNALMKRLTKKLTVKLINKSPSRDVFQILYVGGEPEIGAQLVNTLRDNYIASSQQQLTQVLKNTHAFFETETKQEREKIAALEAELNATASLHMGADPKNQNKFQQLREQNITLLRKLQTQREDKLAEIMACEEYLAELKKHQKAEQAPTSQPLFISSGFAPNPQRKKLANEMDALRQKIQQEKNLRHKTDQHPEIVALNQQLDMLRKEFNSQPEVIPINNSRTGGNNPSAAGPIAQTTINSQNNLGQLNKELAKIERSLAEQKSIKEKLERDLKLLPERQKAFRLRQNELEEASDLLKEWELHLAELDKRLSLATKNRGTRFATLQKAHASHQPMLPKISVVYIISFGAGLALACVCVFLKETFDRSIRNPARIDESLGIPVIETIGEIPAVRAGLWFSRSKYLWLITVLQALLVTGLSISVYLSLDNPVLFNNLIERLKGSWLSM